MEKIKKLVNAHRNEIIVCTIVTGVFILFAIKKGRINKRYLYGLNPEFKDLDIISAFATIQYSDGSIDVVDDLEALIQKMAK